MPSVVILCTGNSCRSILAEAIWREETRGLWRCASAGTQPAESPHPLALAVLEEEGIPVQATATSRGGSYGKTWICLLYSCVLFFPL